MARFSLVMMLTLAACAGGKDDEVTDTVGNDTDLPPPEPYYFVLIEDTTGEVGIADPGTDIDKVQLKTEDDKELVGFVLDSNIGLLNNQHDEVQEMVGGGSADCDDGYVSLGDGGWVLFGFGDEDEPIEMIKGDSLHVTLIDPSDCADHDLGTSFTLSVGRTNDTSFFELVEPKDEAEWAPRKYEVPR